MNKNKKEKNAKSRLTKEEKIQMQKKQWQSKRRKTIAITIMATTIIVSAIAISTLFSLFTLTNNQILSGITIEGIEVSGLTKQEAQSKLELIYNEKKEKEIDAKYQEYETTINQEVIEVNYEIEKAVDQAYLIGRRENIFLSNYEVLFTIIGKKDIKVNMTINEEIAKQVLEGITNNLPGVAKESNYSIEEDELIISKGKKGIEVDTIKSLEKIKETLSDITNSQSYIEIQVKQKEPQIIDIEKIHEEICKEAKDAYYTKNPIVVYPEVEGITFDLEQAKETLAEEKEEYVIKLTITKPQKTLNDIGEEAFIDKLGACTTRYDISDTDRTTNLEVACKKIDGKIILPGETFSYNKALGERTIAAGYKNGRIYSGGKVVDGIGGGICQISTTLYNAVLTANLEIVERRNHQFVTGYIEAGKDATVVYGVTDFKFKNTRKYPVKITAKADAGIASVSICGIKEEKEYVITITTKTIATIPAVTKYIEDDTLPVGTEQIKQIGANGLKTETYITRMLDGKVVSTGILSRDTYDAMQKVVIKGTKK